MRTNMPMKTKKEKIKRIYKRSIAVELRKRGFNIIGTEPNPYKPQFDVYLFEDTEEFENGLTEVLTP